MNKKESDSPRQEYEQFLKSIQALPQYSPKKQNVAICYLLDTLEDLNADLSPVFQRDLVWSQEMKIALIQAIFQNKTPNLNIIFGKLENDKIYRLIDGQQRLNAIISFLKEEFSIFQGIAEIEQGEGLHFSSLTRAQRIFLNTESNLVFNFYTFSSEKEMVQFYINFNQCGLPHTKEEMQKAFNYMETL